MSFRIALSGLEAASTDLDVTGNNIANAGTTGFKESRAEFSDIYATSIQDLGTQAAGRGVRVARVSQQFSQGTVEFTNNNTDLAINGEGFFVVEDDAGSRFYTRSGAFTVDREGYMVNHAGQRLQVYDAVTSTTPTTFDTGSLIDLQLQTQPSAPSASSTITAGINLNASDTILGAGTIDPATATSYTSATSITIYDTLGDSHTATMYFRRTGALTWDVATYVPDATAATELQGPSTLTFTAAGAPTGTTTLNFNGFAFTNGASAINLATDFSTATQFAGEFGVNDLSQNGYASGRLNGIDVSDTGVVFARFTNGRSTELGKVVMAKFNNPNGLGKEGDNNWTETFESGDAQLGEASTASFGSIQSGALELSNVDIATQLVKLIVAQRNFQANTKVISTADQVTQAVINIR
ncbi:MAG: flagellar hook protein FlgE [Candidatus Sedimenticola sp. PURPLELP]